MEIIRKLTDMIGEEIDDADKYATCALKHKDSNRDLADVFYRLSTEEMGHMNMLHEQAAKIIEAYRRDKGEPPAEMMAVYDYLHKQHIDHAASVKAKQMLYKE